MQVGSSVKKVRLEKHRRKRFLLKYANQTSITAVRGKYAYFVHISGGTKNNIKHPVSFLFVIEAKPCLILKTFLPTDWSLKISKEAQPLLLSASKHQTKSKGNMSDR